MAPETPELKYNVSDEVVAFDDSVAETGGEAPFQAVYERRFVLRLGLYSENQILVYKNGAIRLTRNTIIVI